MEIRSPDAAPNSLWAYYIKLNANLASCPSERASLPRKFTFGSKYTRASPKWPRSNIQCVTKHAFINVVARISCNSVTIGRNGINFVFGTLLRSRPTGYNRPSTMPPETTTLWGHNTPMLRCRRWFWVNYAMDGRVYTRIMCVLNNTNRIEVNPIPVFQ